MMNPVRPLLLSAALSLIPAVPGAEAQTVPGDGGFVIVAPPYATGEERQAQVGLWVFEVHFRSMRMLELDITDPKTSGKKKELVYYLVYKAVNREIETRVDETDTVPVNDYDRDPVPDLFVPQFTLVTDDNGVRTVVQDSVLPEAQAAIRRRERLPLLNPVETVQKVPPVVPADEQNPEAILGVAIFRNVNPDTDFFTVFLTGFSNGYKLVRGPVAWSDLRQLAQNGGLKFIDQIWNGRLEEDWKAAASVGDLFDQDKAPPPDADASSWYYTVTSDRADESTTVWRKTLIQRYWRPGDRFDQNEREIRPQGEPRWIYRPEDLPAVDEPVISGLPGRTRESGSPVETALSR